jgi:hypothetical protein
MRSFRLISTAALTASLLGAGVAQADAPWSEPVTPTSGINAFWRPSLTFTGDGHAVATLDGSGSCCAPGARGLSRILVAEQGASTFTEVGRTVHLAGPATYGARGVAYLRTPPLAPGQSINDVKVTRLGVSLGTVPGSLGRFQPLARVAQYPVDVKARIAADPRGNVAAAWIEPRRSSLRIALRRPGQAFGRATTLAAGGFRISEIELAYGANGDLVVSFKRRNTRVGGPGPKSPEIAVRIKRAGRRFGPIQSVGPARAVASIATAVAPTGRAVVAWGTQDAGIEANEPWTVRAALLRSGAHRFSSSQLLDPGVVARPVGPVRAAIGPNGAATVAWSGVAGTRGPLSYPVRVATARPTGRFGAGAQFAPSGRALDVVTARDGTTSVLWGPSTDPDNVVLDRTLVSRRASGASVFAPPEAVSHDEPAASAAIALDPRNGRPAVLWIGAPGGLPGQPLDQVAVEPRYSTRGG